MKPTSEIQTKKQTLEKNIQKLIEEFITEVGACDVQTETVCVYAQDNNREKTLITARVNVNVTV